MRHDRGCESPLFRFEALQSTFFAVREPVAVVTERVARLLASAAHDLGCNRRAQGMRQAAQGLALASPRLDGPWAEWRDTASAWQRAGVIVRYPKFGHLHESWVDVRVRSWGEVTLLAVFSVSLARSQIDPEQFVPPESVPLEDLLPSAWPLGKTSTKAPVRWGSSCPLSSVDDEHYALP